MRIHRRFLSELALTSVLVAGCSAGAVEATIPVLGDPEVLWCDESRWQVADAAGRLGLDPLALTNPPVQVLLAEGDAEGERLRSGHALGRISDSEYEDGLKALEAHLRSSGERFLSGEWVGSGVDDATWDSYKVDHPDSYTRACRAAFELRAG